MDQKGVAHGLLLRTALFCLFVLSACGQREANTEVQRQDEQKDVIEGDKLLVLCNVTISTGGQVYWTNNEGVQQFGRLLNITNVTRRDTGLYTCNAFNSSNINLAPTDRDNVETEIYMFFLRVVYPAKILFVQLPSKVLNIGTRFVMQFGIEGLPAPNTTFTSLSDGRILLVKNTSGVFHLTILSVQCSYNGFYELTCRNTIGNDSRRESITVRCRPEPDPRLPSHTTINPRVGENVNLTVHSVGYPAPTYMWWYGGTQLFNHTDTPVASVLTLDNLNVDNFGDYLMMMKNTAGTTNIQYHIRADGPPDAVSNLQVSDVTDSTANLSFTTGYDYNDTQTFFIMREFAGNITDFRKKVQDTSDDHGDRPFSIVVTQLNGSTVYQLTVLSGNSRGNSSRTPSIVKFTTTGKPEPDPTFPLNTTAKPRLGDHVTFTMHSRGHPMPSYQWWRNGARINSTDEQYNTSITISNIDVDDFGIYLLNMTNLEGVYSQVYDILANGPPAPVSHLSVADVILSGAHLNFTTGYNYNKTQTFLIQRYEDGAITYLNECKDLTSGRGGDPFTCILDNLKEDTLYNVTVASNNSQGVSKSTGDFVTFFTSEKPKPDPDRPTNSSIKPRLGESATLSINAIGHPPPEFEWWHNSKQLNSSIDTSYTSILRIDDMTVVEFGEYTLLMINNVGFFAKEFEIIADGPPAPVSGFQCNNVTADSVRLDWMAGYAYNNTQKFLITGKVNNKRLEIKPIQDTTAGAGGLETFTLDSLQSSSTYILSVVAENVRGSAANSNTVKFTTKDGPAPNKGGLTTSEKVVYASGGIGAVVLIVLVISAAYWCNKRKNIVSVPYKEARVEVQETRLQAHHYRYDDAAAPPNT